MQTDLDEMNSELRAAEDRAKKAMADAARLADELRQEQEHSLQVSAACLSLLPRCFWKGFAADSVNGVGRGGGSHK